ncbi:MAG: MaoC/PaaZ C-terminal domain-containing protein [Acidimicrobiia bacterium]
MPVDPGAVGRRVGPVRRTWDERDAILYALGVGAGAEDPCEELQYTTENTEGVAQRALPTIAVVLGNAMEGLLDQAGDFDRSMMVHGFQGVTLFDEIPVAGEIETVSEIVGVHDKGSGALVVGEMTSRLVGSDRPLFSCRNGVFVRGAGGFGGDRGPSGAVPVPDRAPDLEVRCTTRPDQALLYRLSFDRFPLHSDPAYARRAGFERPILHGLCTYGFTGRVLLRDWCDDDPARCAAMEGRFSSPVLPGEELVVQSWELDDGVAFVTRGGDGRVVLDGGRLTRR